MSAAVSNLATGVASKAPQRDAINRHVAAFIAAGGTIKSVSGFVAAAWRDPVTSLTTAEQSERSKRGAKSSARLRYGNRGNSGISK